MRLVALKGLSMAVAQALGLVAAYPQCAFCEDFSTRSARRIRSVPRSVSSSSLSSLSLRVGCRHTAQRLWTLRAACVMRKTTQRQAAVLPGAALRRPAPQLQVPLVARPRFEPDVSISRIPVQREPPGTIPGDSQTHSHQWNE